MSAEGKSFGSKTFIAAGDREARAPYAFAQAVREREREIGKEGDDTINRRLKEHERLPL